MNYRKNNLIFLCLAQFVDRFSYYGIQSLLLFYVSNILMVPSSASYEIYGAFTALSFIMTILGGWLADQFLGFKRSVLLGLFFLLIGNFALASGIKELIFFGLAIFVGGIGLFLPNNASLLGSFYKNKDNQRAKDFTIFYMASNAGALLGPVIYGLLFIYCWRYPFLLTDLLVIFWFIFYLKNKHKFNKAYERISSTQKRRVWFYHLYAYIAICCVIASSFLLLKYPIFTAKLLMIIGGVSLSFILFKGGQENKKERSHVFLLVFMLFCSLFFFSCAFQIYTSLLMFINGHVNKIILGIKIPAPMFSSLESLFIILMSPSMGNFWKKLSVKNKEPSMLTKQAIGLFCAGLSFGVFALGAYSAFEIRGNASLLWILGGNLLLGLGEICIMPTILSAITQIAPQKMKGLLMGALYLSFAFSGYFASVIGELISEKHFNSVFSYFITYKDIFYLTMLVAVIVYGVSYLTKSFLQEIEVTR